MASVSFDKSVKLWNGTIGKFVAAFRGHVGPVYQIRFELILLFLFKLILSFTQTIIMFRYPTVSDKKFFLPYSWSADSRLLLSGSKDSTLKVNYRNYYLPFLVFDGLSYG